MNKYVIRVQCLKCIGKFWNFWNFFFNFQKKFWKIFLKIFSENFQKFKEKWRTKEEWNRLKIERQIFKENQDRVIENVQREKLDLANKLVCSPLKIFGIFIKYAQTFQKFYHKDQTELLFRLSSERELLEQEKSEFFA